MILPVLQYPDPRLGRQCRDISDITPELRELASSMIETMYARDGIGLAAPQVGEDIRMIVIDISGPEKREDPRVLINPKLSLGGLCIDSEEGCLSVKDYRAVVTRKEKARVEALDLDGNKLSFEADDILAICLQHECDHLDGKLFIDHISRLKRGMFDRRIIKKTSGDA